VFKLYSPNCVEEEFSEIRIAPVLCCQVPATVAGTYPLGIGFFLCTVHKTPKLPDGGEPFSSVLPSTDRSVEGFA
jgi:hypothetical protein